MTSRSLCMNYSFHIFCNLAALNFFLAGCWTPCAATPTALPREDRWDPMVCCRLCSGQADMGTAAARRMCQTRRLAQQLFSLIRLSLTNRKTRKESIHRPHGDLALADSCRTACAPSPTRRGPPAWGTWGQGHSLVPILV